MRNPLSPGVERAIAVGLLFAAVWLWLSAERHRAADNALADVKLTAATKRAAAWQSFYQADAARVDTIADTVTREVARVRVDTVWRHDTLHVAGDTVQRTLVPTSALGRMDAALRSCGHLAASIVPLRTDCDSLVAAEHDRGEAWHAKYAAVRPRWYDRLGVWLGVPLLDETPEGIPRIGGRPLLGVGLRVWP